jgi:hypothetical protein
MKTPQALLVACAVPVLLSGCGASEPNHGSGFSPEIEEKHYQQHQAQAASDSKEFEAWQRQEEAYVATQPDKAAAMEHFAKLHPMPTFSTAP